MIISIIMDYLTIIKYATIAFPLVALLSTIPFILIELRKYGSISFLKSIITYMFIYYLICAYFLVILPLPKISEVALLTTPRIQLIPFNFVIDFIKHSSLDITNIKTYISAFKESYFYVPAFNILLTIPFGMFLKYYFNCSMKKTIWYTFLLSLFFEITQLTGLYFIYPRGYRLCDVDDLILNTLGGFFGYLICTTTLKLLPKMDKINMRARERGMRISGFRRTTAFLLDLFMFIFIDLIFIIIFNDNIYLNTFIFIMYYFVIPLILNTSTLGEKFLNIKVLDYKNRENNLRLLFRRLLFILIYIIIPFAACNLVFNIKENYVREFSGIIVLGLIFLIYCITIIKYLFTSSDMLYEKISKTKLISTINEKND